MILALPAKTSLSNGRCYAAWAMLAAFASCVLIAVPGIASAQTPPSPAAPPTANVEPPPANEPQTPAAHLATARQFFKAQQYPEAAEALRRAYALEPKPLYLFNAGTAYRKGEKLALALDMYKRYVEAVPDGELANEARAYIKDLTDLLDAQKRLEANNQALQGANQLLDNERNQTQQTQLALEQEKKRVEQIQIELEKAKRKPWYRRPPFIVLSTVVAGLGLIVGMTALAISQSGKTEGGTHSVSF